MSTSHRGKLPKKRNDNSRTFKELRKERKRRYYDKYRDGGRRKNQGRKFSIGRGRKFHDSKRKDFRGYSRRATRFRNREERTRLNKNRDYANNISNNSKDASNSNDNSGKERRFRFEYNPERCYKCKRLGHFKKDCGKMSRRTKSILEAKAKREMNKVNAISDKEQNNLNDERNDENMGLNIQSQTKRNERQVIINKEEQKQALAYLSQSTNPGQSRSSRS